jgi:hypothetical protein
MYAGLYPGGGVIFYNQGDTSPILTDYYENDNLIAVTLDVDVRNYVRFTIDYINPAYIYGTDMNFVIKPFDMNLTLGTKKESLFKRATEVSVVTTPNPYVDVEAMKFMVVEDNRKSPLYYYAVGAGSATGLVVLLNLLLR